MNEFSGPGNWVEFSKSNITYCSLLGVPPATDRTSSFNTSTYYHSVQSPEIRYINNTRDRLCPFNIPFALSYKTSTILKMKVTLRFFSAHTQMIQLLGTMAGDTSPVTCNLLDIIFTRFGQYDFAEPARKSYQNINSRLFHAGEVDKLANIASLPTSFFLPPLMMGYSEPFGLLTARLECAGVITQFYSTPKEHYFQGGTTFPFAHGS